MSVLLISFFYLHIIHLFIKIWYTIVLIRMYIIKVVKEKDFQKYNGLLLLSTLRDFL